MEEPRRNCAVRATFYPRRENSRPPREETFSNKHMMNNTTTSGSNIERAVMRRIHLIRILGLVIFPGVLAILTLVLALWGIGRKCGSRAYFRTPRPTSCISRISLSRRLVTLALLFKCLRFSHSHPSSISPEKPSNSLFPHSLLLTPDFSMGKEQMKNRYHCPQSMISKMYLILRYSVEYGT